MKSSNAYSDWMAKLKSSDAEVGIKQQVNLNDWISVTLTVKGAAVYRSLIQSSALISGDALRIQLWQAFTLFGPAMYISADPVFEDNAITFIEKVA